jgi:Zn-dependent M16 (insulinase) family peptidase
LGVQGVHNDVLKEAEKVIFDTLRKVKEEGIDEAHFEETLH